MSEWIKTIDQEPPKDGTIFLAKTIYCGSPSLLLLYWYKKGYWECQCGCVGADFSVVGDIIEWMEIDE